MSCLWCRNADRKIWFGNPSFEVASNTELQNIPAYMEKLLKKHGFCFSAPGFRTRIRKLVLNLSNPAYKQTAYNRLDQLE